MSPKRPRDLVQTGANIVFRYLTLGLCLFAFTSCSSSQEKLLDARGRLAKKYFETKDPRYLSLIKAITTPRTRSHEPTDSELNAYWLEQERQRREDRRHRELMNHLEDSRRQRAIGYGP